METRLGFGRQLTQTGHPLPELLLQERRIARPSPFFSGLRTRPPTLYLPSSHTGFCIFADIMESLDGGIFSLSREVRLHSLVSLLGSISHLHQLKLSALA
jgi:hypothetical protein